MTTQELIAKLQTMPADAEVRTLTTEGRLRLIADIQMVSDATGLPVGSVILVCATKAVQLKDK